MQRAFIDDETVRALLRTQGVDAVIEKADRENKLSTVVENLHPARGISAQQKLRTAGHLAETQLPRWSAVLAAGVAVVAAGLWLIQGCFPMKALSCV